MILLPVLSWRSGVRAPIFSLRSDAKVQCGELHSMGRTEPAVPRADRHGFLGESALNEPFEHGLPARCAKSGRRDAYAPSAAVIVQRRNGICRRTRTPCPSSPNAWAFTTAHSTLGSNAACCRPAFNSP